MISTAILWVMAAIGAVLFVYSFIDNDNRVLGHIFASGVAMVLFFLLGSLVLSGNVGDVEGAELTRTTVNATVEYTYTTVTVPMEYPAVGWVFVFLAVIMLIFIIMAIIEIVRESVDGDLRYEDRMEDY